jgi:hypothetical protein
VSLTRNASASTRRALLDHPLVGTCAVPGEHVREFAGRWDPRFRRYGTALLTDNPGVVIARDAISCALYVGREGATPDLAVFPSARSPACDCVDASSRADGRSPPVAVAAI